MTWNVAHNFPGAKDTYQVPVDYPTVGYDTIIAAWFTDVFTSILAMQESLIGATAIFLLKAGGTMTGDLTFESAMGVNSRGIVFHDTEEELTDALIKLNVDLGGLLISQGDIVFINGGGAAHPQVEFSGVLIRPVQDNSIELGSAGRYWKKIACYLGDFKDDVEVSDKTKGLILKSPNNSRFRLEVSDGGVLSTEAL